jgi:uncharacterized protein
MHDAKESERRSSRGFAVCIREIEDTVTFLKLLAHHASGWPLFQHVHHSLRPCRSRITHHGAIALLLVLALPLALADVAIPPLSSHVTDLTHTLTRDQAASLEQTLSAFEAKKGSQIAVLIVPTIEPESIEQYSMRVAEAWKIGRKGTDDGVIFVVAKNDRKMRIEVGYGLEGALPDVTAKRIIRDAVTPHFRAGEYYLGIVAATDRIMQTIDGEPLPEPTLTERASRPSSNIGSILVVFLIAQFVVGGILRAIFGRFGGASLTAGAAGIIVWLLAGTLVFAILAALVAFLITLFTGGGGGWSSGRRSGWGSWGPGIGGFGGSNWGGGGGSSWGGGGGGFGGGGASGSW